jgi:hypothetical protein
LKNFQCEATLTAEMHSTSEGASKSRSRTTKLPPIKTMLVIDSLIKLCVNIEISNIKAYIMSQGFYELSNGVMISLEKLGDHKTINDEG